LTTSASKWVGGVVAPNGYIYGIPYDSASVLKIDPTTDTATTFGNFVGTAKWRGGVLAPDGHIYGIPYDSNTILKIDPTTDTATTTYSLGPIFRKQITISHTYVTTDLINFPLCVKITADTDIGAACLASGDDITFTDADGINLAVECETFSVTSGSATGVFWVCVPLISSASNTAIYCCYGDSLATPRTNTTSVWDSDFKGVWHLGDGSTLSAADSTNSGSSGTITGITAGAGQTDGCAVFDGSTSHGISVPPGSNFDLTNNTTLECWFKTSFAGSPYQTMIALFDESVSSGTPIGYRIVISGSGSNYKIQFGMRTVDAGTWYNVFSSTAGLNNGIWHHVAVVRADILATVYVDGVSVATLSVPSDPVSAPYGAFRFGNSYYNGMLNEPFTGSIDETRISQTNRSASWVIFTYRNQSSSNQLTWGNQTAFHRWSGGVLAANGYIYGIPSNSDTILKIDPATDTVTTFGSLGSGSDLKWIGGVLSPDGSIYGIPYNNSEILKISTASDITTAIGKQVYYKQITISCTHVSTDLINFPLCVVITSDADMGAKCLPSGYDIYFTDSCRNMLYVEQESFSITNGLATGVFWVRVPVVSSSTNTIINCCYGDSEATARTNTTSVWDSNFRGVWHLGDGTTLSVKDSTAYACDGVNSGATASTGPVGGCAYVDGSTYITVDNAYVNLTTSLTMSCWAKRIGWMGAWASLLCKPYYLSSWTMPYQHYRIARSSTNDVFAYTTNTQTDAGVINTTNIGDGVWYHIAASMSAGAAYMYVNGVLVDSGSCPVPIACSGTTPLYICHTGTGDVNFRGYVDEVRLSDMARSDAWIAFEYYNQYSGEITWGSESTIRTCGYRVPAVFAGGVISMNNIIYGIPSDNASSILKIDPITDTATTFGTITDVARWAGGVLGPNGLIYGIPHNSTTILQIDPTTDTFTTFSSLTGTSKWCGGSVSLDGAIYGIPYTSDTVLKIGASLDDVQSGFCLSRYFNKF